MSRPLSATLPLLAMTLAVGGTLGCSSREQAGSRRFRFDYSTRISGIPRHARAVRVWIPLPRSDSIQSITALSVDAPVAPREIEEPLYGNRGAFFELTEEIPEALDLRVRFDVERSEASVLREVFGEDLRSRCLRADRLVQIDGPVALRAVEATGGRHSVEEKARAIYERVLADVDYDKSGVGWGRGDTRYVCEVGKGNCSDFHSLFIGMARAEKIPAFFEIGFPVPADKKEGAVGGYHCWAWYESSAGLWSPIDASEADKAPARADYFFGTLCENRVAFSRGRDLILDPPQSGEPVNFWIYPYVEVDGRADVAFVENRFSFQELDA